MVLHGRDPDPFEGPGFWEPSIGECLVHEDSTYEYTLCLFHNVTQRKKHNANEAYLLGVWGGWIGDDFTEMKYNDGTACSSTVNRQTTVEITRATAPARADAGSEDDSADAEWQTWPVTKITELSEPVPCEYVIKLEYAYRDDMESSESTNDGAVNDHASSDAPGASEDFQPDDSAEFDSQPNIDGSSATTVADETQVVEDQELESVNGVEESREADAVVKDHTSIDDTASIDIDVDASRSQDRPHVDQIASMQSEIRNLKDVVVQLLQEQGQKLDNLAQAVELAEL